MLEGATCDNENSLQLSKKSSHLKIDFCFREMEFEKKSQLNKFLGFEAKRR